jgi:hypothetical protein
MTEPFDGRESFAELMMNGGLSLVLLSLLLVDHYTGLTTFATVLAAIGLVLDGPHLLSTYQLLYGDCRSLILRDRRFFFAAIIAPVLILLASLIMLRMNSAASIGLFIFARLVSTAWHSMRQSYGAFVFVFRRQNFSFAGWEKWLVRLNFYFPWLTSAALYMARPDFFPAPFNKATFSFKLPIAFVYFGLAASAISLVLLLANIIKRCFASRTGPSVAGVLSVFSFYINLLPFRSPVQIGTQSHSLQYIFFVYIWKRKSNSNGGRAARQLRYLLYVGMFSAMGWGVFALLPNWLSDHGYDLPQLLTWGLVMNTIFTFHHVVIDSVIWRRDNKFNTLT